MTTSTLCSSRIARTSQSTAIRSNINGPSPSAGSRQVGVAHLFLSPPSASRGKAQSTRIFGIQSMSCSALAPQVCDTAGAGGRGRVAAGGGVVPRRGGRVGPEGRGRSGPLRSAAGRPSDRDSDGDSDACAWRVGYWKPPPRAPARSSGAFKWRLLAAPGPDPSRGSAASARPPESGPH